MRGPVKNPFGNRDGKLITIGDLTPAERGAKCNCVCPDCGGTFNARLGSKRQPHFAHEKDSMCDPEKAFLESLYRFLCDAISDTNSFTYPGLYGFFPGFDIRRTATRADIESVVSYSDKELPPGSDYETIIESNEFSVSGTEIQRNAKGLPQALLAKHISANGNEHILAIIIVLPENVCKTFIAKQYKNYPTVSIQISDDLYQVKSDVLKQRLRDDVADKTWAYSPKIEKWLNDQVEKQHMRHQQYLRERHEAALRTNVLDKQQHQHENNREDRISVYLTKKYTTVPDEILYYGGERWCFCEKCKTYRPAQKMINFKSACRAECWKCPTKE